MSQIPYWQLPRLWRAQIVPTWKVVFLLPLEETEQDLFMTRLVTIDKNWPYRPNAEPRRLLHVPWLFDFIPDSSILAPIFERCQDPESLIFIDEQSKKDDTALLLYYSGSNDNHCTLRVPINTANLILSATAEEKIILEGEKFQPLGYDTPAIIKQGKQKIKEDCDWPVFIIESMTPEELERLASYAEDRMVDEYENTQWFNVADKLKSPDMKGLLAWFESPQCDFPNPPSYFLAVDRWSLEVADDQSKFSDLWAECMVASEEGGAIYLRDDEHNNYASWTCGYGYNRESFEDGVGICTNLSQGNQSFSELVQGPEYLYWKASKQWAENAPRHFHDGFILPEGKAYLPSV